ncbi:extracellular matrix/biofilm biosynthesis regulator RemA family protein [Leptospira sp. GIMC2001]|uniref:extracellular matrix/biofilm biosynthesis regulator RemA family protein n=1 Tax=Leptospira sp. GIMC2001 TaxID=1513297 RepID=UPI00234AB134|nr:extracellular matrix/biofilm biosynthesis regulator RemA family protein [Leptospira sp. GIMC2001]WCL48263.1 DUF370 domain-containing protein [Leptospira sp. GIMC2001]
MEEYFLLNIGFSNVVVLSKLVGILSADSAGARRLRSEAKENKNLVDATMGRKTRSIVVLASGHIFLSAIRPESLSKRVEKKDNQIGLEEEKEESNEV